MPVVPQFVKYSVISGLVLILSGILLFYKNFLNKQESKKKYEQMIQSQIPKLMRAVVLNGFGAASDVLQIKSDVPVPEPASEKNEVLIKTAATAVNRADIMQRKGHYPPPPGASPLLGLEASGTIVKAAGKWKVGDQVMCLLSGGGYAEYVVAHADQCMPIPKSCPSMAHAAGTPEVFLTAYQCCRASGLASALPLSQKSSKHVLIHAGASGVGTALSQIVTAFNAEPVITASKDKLDDPLIKQLNPKYRFERDNVGPVQQQKPAENESSSAAPRPKTPPVAPLPSWVAQIENAIGKNAIDFVVDPVVGGGYLAGDLELLKLDGTVIVLAMMGGATLPQFDVAKLFRKRAQVIGSTLRSRDNEYKGKLVSDFVQNVYPLLWQKQEDSSNLEFGPVISKVLKMEEVVKAHEMIENNECIGKVILEW
jgi:NADPH:quinone reductase-like Zn-dependent oxidoreductase